MDLKDYSLLHSKIDKSTNENSIKNVLPSNLLFYTNVFSPIISGEETGTSIVINPQLEPQFASKVLSINENLEVEKGPSVSDAHSETIKDCLESTIIPRKDTCGVTPSREISKSFMFQHGVTFTSTPLNKNEIKNGTMNVFDNLSIIKEEEESLLPESKELAAESENSPQAPKECTSAEKENKPFLSVLKKDELSLLIDIPNERILTEEKVDANNHNLTLSVQNSEVVVYKNIVDKTIDDLLIEGNELERIKDICDLEIESDRKDILDKAITLKPFISPNEDENRDNNDPEWELLRKLETDDER